MRPALHLVTIHTNNPRKNGVAPIKAIRREEEEDKEEMEEMVLPSSAKLAIQYMLVPHLEFSPI